MQITKCAILAGVLTIVFYQCSSSKRTSILERPSKTLTFLRSISGKQTITGIHNREPNATPAKWTDEIFHTTEKHPALWSGDFLFQADNINNRQIMIEEALNQWNKGALVNLMWHACNPALQQPCGWDKQGVLSQLTDTQWKELTTDGSVLNVKWKKMMDEVSIYLQFLEDKKVEVMFRPLHEMNQNVFWWGGRPGTAGTVRLWQITHDYFTKAKGLSNLIWVWDIQDFPSLASDAESYYPGDNYYDIAALDVYDDRSGYSREKYEVMLKASRGKPVGIGECQKLPTADILAAQPKWSFFMSWSELTYSNNTIDEIKALYTAPNTLTLEELKRRP